MIHLAELPTRYQYKL